MLAPVAVRVRGTPAHTVAGSGLTPIIKEVFPMAMVETVWDTHQPLKPLTLYVVFEDGVTVSTLPGVPVFQL